MPENTKIKQKNYLGLIESIWKLNRVHVSDEMSSALNKTKDFYQGSEILRYKSGQGVGGGETWVIPDKWVVHHATLKDEDGKKICDFEESPLRLFSYSPSFNGKISRTDLIENHIFSLPGKPNSIPFHFRNQYRPWDRKWGFCLTHNEVTNLNKKNYLVEIKTEFVPAEMEQLEYTHQGISEKRFLFLGHFDHPAQCNDGLTGCIVANEVIKRLEGRKTYYTYSALNTVEIVGSVAYCQFEKKKIKNTIGALFIAMSSSTNNFSYQYSSSPETYIIDRIMKNLLIHKDELTEFANFRELIGNDEIAFETPGVNIACSSITRWPFEHYHTSEDNFQNIDVKKMEEKINLVLDLVFCLENNYLIQTNFTGLPCLSNPKLNLYLEPTELSQSVNFMQVENELFAGMNEAEIESVTNKSDKLNNFMNQLVAILSRNTDQKIDIITIAEKFNLPFKFVLNYLRKWEKVNLLKLTDLVC